MNVLDLGCGGGANTWFLAREGFNVFGIDGSPSTIQQASNLLKMDKLDAALSVGDFTQLEYDAQFFDAVLDSSAVQHNTWNNILNIHSQVQRILKPQGLFLGLMINIETTGAETGNELEKNTFSNIKEGLAVSSALTHMFTLEEVNTLMENYEDVTVDRLFRTANNNQHTIGHYIASGRRRAQL